MRSSLNVYQLLEATGVPFGKKIYTKQTASISIASRLPYLQHATAAPAAQSLDSDGYPPQSATPASEQQQRDKLKLPHSWKQLQAVGQRKVHSSRAFPKSKSLSR